MVLPVDIGKRRRKYKIAALISLRAYTNIRTIRSFSGTPVIHFQNIRNFDTFEINDFCRLIFAVSVYHVRGDFHAIACPNARTAYFFGNCGKRADCGILFNFSTASPFKFCDSVLTALGVKELQPGTAILQQLTEATGKPAPKPLASLAGKEVRFTQVTEKEAMAEVVSQILC